MILVALGTQDKKFTRLLVELDRLIDEGLIQDKVIVQAGDSATYKSSNMEIFDLISKEDFDKLIKECNLLITHGGVGIILTGLINKRKVIAVPRYKKYKEHINDHQLQIIENFDAEGYIIGVKNVSDLEGALEKAKTFTPKPYIRNKDNMLSLVKKLIDK